MKKSLILLISLLIFPVIIVLIINFIVTENEKNPSYIIDDFGNDLNKQESVFIFWQENQNTFDDEGTLIKHYKFADLKFFGEVYIWAKKDQYVYALGVERKYVKMNFKTAEFIEADDLHQFSSEDVDIFLKLESHPELFLNGQWIDKQHPAYEGPVKGELKLGNSS